MAGSVEITPRFLYAEYGHTLMIRPAEDESSDALFERVCADFENTKIEQDSKGNVYIMAPAGGESSDQNSELTMQLRVWAKADGRGRAFDSSVCFILPDKSKLSPDGSWVRTEKLSVLSREQRRKLLTVAPDFVIEIKSPTDRWSDLQGKMQDFRRNGVPIGWLINPDKRKVLIYRQGESHTDMLDDPQTIKGEGLVAGFTLDLQPIWQGLNF